MTQLDNIKLNLILELNPWDFTEDPYPYDKDNTIENRYKWWKHVMTSVGINQIEPISKSNYVNTNSISNSDLMIILKDHMERNGPGEYSDSMSPLYGGVLLLNNDEIMISPNCCTDMVDHYQWLEIEPTKIPKQIWIGHPWIFYKTEGTEIIFSNFVEKNSEDLLPEDLILKGSLNQILEEAEKLKEYVSNFETQVRNCLTEIGHEKPGAMAKCLIYGECDAFRID